MSRRPLFYWGVAACLGSALGSALYLCPDGWVRAAWVAMLCVAAILSSLRLCGVRATWPLTVVALVYAVHGGVILARPSDAGVIARQGVERSVVGGTVVSEVVRTEGILGTVRESFMLRAERIWVDPRSDGRAGSGRVKVSLVGPTPVAQGDQVVISGQLRPPRPPSNPGGFDAALYLRARGCDALLYGDKEIRPRILRQGPAHAVEKALLSLRRQLSSRLDETLEEREAAFLKALFFGERTDMADGEKELFLRTGTAHILAVSGFNVGFLCAVVYFICAAVRVPRPGALLAALAVILIYCLLVGWQAPLVRAALMAGVYLAAQLSGRRGDLLNSMGLAALLILAVNPWQIWDAGFQLSFAAVLAMGTAVPVFTAGPKTAEILKSPGQKARESVATLFWVSYACLVFTIPLSAHYFYIVSPIAVVSNLAAVPLTFVIFCGGLLLMVVAGWGAAAQAGANAVAVVLEGMLGILRALDALPGSVATVGRPPMAVILAMYAGMVWILADRRIGGRWTRAAAIYLWLACVLTAQSIGYAWPDGRLRLTVLDVGQGDAMHVRLPRGGDVIIDGGQGGRSDKGKWVILPYLKSQGIQDLDLVVMTHPHEDHAGGLPTLLSSYPVRAYAQGPFMYDDEYTRRIEQALEAQRGVRRLRLAAGDVLRDYGGADIEALYPPRTAHGRAIKLNDESLVLGVRHGRTRAILAADVERVAMRRMLNAGTDLKADVLKVPHHGGWPGREGGEWIARVAPRHAVLSLGERNPFGHPNPHLMQALGSDPERRIHRTDQEGAVRLVSNGRAYMRE